MPQDAFKPFRPDRRLAGVKTKESETAVFTWFGPEGEPDTKFRYAVIQEEGDKISIQPAEARFKTGLTAIRYAAEADVEGTVYVVGKTRPSRIDLVRRPSA